jgi:Ca2+-transporting ATPase
MTATEVMSAVGTTADGLTAADVADRLATVGPNQLTFTTPDPAWKVMARQFVSPLITILLVAACVTAILRHWADAIAILFILLLNAVVGFWQETKAASEVSALADLTVPHCRVLRDGGAQTVMSTEIVPGDIVLLDSGDRVPADLRLTSSRDLRVDESMLTGENLPVLKHTDVIDADAAVADRRCVAFSGTLVASGRATGVVVATGEMTELGQINELIQGPREQTPLQILIHRLERRIGIVVGAVALFVFVAGLIVSGDFAQAFLSAVALAVAAIPEALPVVLTIAMALGVRHMAQVNAVVRTLPSVETLGSTSIIGSDKTGTLTQNILTVGHVWTSAGLTRLDHDDHASDPLVRETLTVGALTNEARPDADARAGFTGDAVDVAMAAAAVKFGAVSDAGIIDEPMLHQEYEPHVGFSQSLRRAQGGTCVLYVKGAPDKLLEMSTHLATAAGPRPLDRRAVHEANEQMASAGLRVIATARRVFAASEVPDEELVHPHQLEFVGMEGMSDPTRPGVADAIAACRAAGIDVVMITGDHPVTAAAIADELGIRSRVPITGIEVAALDDAGLLARLGETGVAARVTPQDKLRIVQALRASGRTVAVTGDGVNDAPALKAASIGVAMGASGTEVAREAANIVLTDDNFVSIVRAVEQGRITFAAIRKATFFLLSTAVAVLLAVAINTVSGLPLLFLPIQVLWINVVTNGLQDVALAFEPAEGGELKRPPRSSREGLLSRILWIRIAVSGFWMGLCILLSFRIALDMGYDDTHARTLALTVFVALNFFQVGNARTEYRSLFSFSPFSNTLLLITAVGSLLLQWGAMSWSVSKNLLSLTPLTFTEWAWCLGVGASVLVLVEAEKWWRRRYSLGELRGSA